MSTDRDLSHVDPDDRRAIEQAILFKVFDMLRSHGDDPINHLRRLAATDDEDQRRPGTECHGMKRGECLATIIEHDLFPEDP